MPFEIANQSFHISKLNQNLGIEIYCFEIANQLFHISKFYRNIKILIYNILKLQRKKLYILVKINSYFIKIKKQFLLIVKINSYFIKIKKQFLLLMKISEPHESTKIRAPWYFSDEIMKGRHKVMCLWVCEYVNEKEVKWWWRVHENYGYRPWVHKTTARESVNTTRQLGRH